MFMSSLRPWVKFGPIVALGLALFPASSPQLTRADSSSSSMWMQERADRDQVTTAQDPVIDCDAGGADNASEDPNEAGRTNQTIELDGANLDLMGTYVIDAVAPSGNSNGEYGASGYQQEQVWPGNHGNTGTAMWHYVLVMPPGPGAAFVDPAPTLSKIDVPTLLQHAKDNGDVVVPGKGLHLRMQDVGDPARLSQTFWLNCAVTPATGRVQGASVAPVPATGGGGSSN